VIPVYLTKYGVRMKHIDLLLLKNDNASHYLWIKNMSALVCNRTKHNRKVFVCPHCVHPFSNVETFDRHFPDCAQHKRQRVILPDENENELCWKSVRKTELFPFVIYADFESYLSPVKAHDNVKSKTQVIDEHIPSGFCCYTVSRDRQFQTEPTLYSGPDCMEFFFDHLLTEQRRISCIMGRDYEMLPLTRSEQAAFNAAVVCPRCNEPFTSKNWKVRHHDHTNGRFISAVCNTCNLKLKFSKRKRDGKSCSIKKGPDGSKIKKNDDFIFKIPVLFHNLVSYDVHHILKNFDSRMVAKFDEKRQSDSKGSVPIIALNLERFVSFEMLYLRFIDSCQFLSASLETLVCNLVKSCDSNFDKFEHTRSQMGTNELLFAKGIFPYEFFDSLDKFNETQLPPKEAFYSNLNEESITDEEYQRALKVWETFDCKNFRQYHDLYLKTDVLLLADVFENFREMGMRYYGLDPAQYLTLPSYSWDACLKYTGVKLELITDVEMHIFIESAIRGGISTITHRHARANNPYMKPEDYDPSTPNSYILYLDANNLYGWAMSQRLPVRNFKFLTAQEIAEIDFQSVSDDSDIGYIVECDLEYPSYLHDAHNDYPLAAENLVVTEEMLSPFCKSFGQKHVECKKLIPNLRNKTKYVTHYRNLKLYTSLGLKVTQIHRVLAFEQEAWMKPYIDFNTQKRQESTSEFLKSLFKLMNNSTFGKTMENVRNRKHIELVSDQLMAKKRIANPRLEQFRIINEDTVLIDRVRKEVTLNKPIYAGFSILDLSKVLMYDFHYNVIVERYGNAARLLFTDTDSLTYHICTDDVYRDLESIIHDYFDTSDYPKDHFLYSCKNAKVLGKMKDECGGKPPIEFVGLRSKMYSLLVQSSEAEMTSKMTAKGIKKSYVKHHVRHEMYCDTLLSKKSTSAKFRNFRSSCHKIQTVKFVKKCLSSYDDKRYILNDGVSTLAYGHYRLTNT
jgi:hypothetical protein